MHELTRRSVLALGAAGAAGLAAGLISASALPALAGAGVPVDMNADADGVMLHGYDPVAYFTDNAAVPGDPAIAAEHGGVRYLFASAAHRDTFLADPEKYVPAYGGHCAMGAAMGLKLDVDPKLFRVVDGKLYLNVHEMAQKRWLSDVPGNIATADAKWPEIRNIPADKLQAN
ncbi:MAG: hypothetical protein Kow0058_08660 [Roseovarius sp.]